MKRMTLIAIALTCLALSATAKRNTEPSPYGLSCEHQKGEVLLDIQTPRLSWKNVREQTAWQVVVATSKDRLTPGKADVWDSGKVIGPESNLVRCKELDLKSMTQYYWAVRTWDSNDKVSSWSEPATWVTGMLDESDWKAQWIGAPWQGDVRNRFYGEAPMFRKEFKVRKGLVSARAFVSGLGWFEMRLNGSKVGDDYFVPGFTDYLRRPWLAENPRIPNEPDVVGYSTLYLSYDITSQVKKGQNAIGFILGNGYFHYNPANGQKLENYGVPRVICQVLLTYKDGSKEIVATDQTWKATASPIVFNDIYLGEVYDATKEAKGWDIAGLDDSSWQNAALKTAPDGKLKANMGPTDKVTETLDPVSFERQEDGSFKVDFGKEISGWIHFKDIVGNAGDTLKVLYIAENPNGRSEYIFSGNGKVSYAPRFDWFVFREAIISGIDNLSTSNMVAEAVNTNVPVNADFQCSNPLFVQINDIWKRSQMDNMHSSVASDCPHRERLPYTGDGQIAMGAVVCNFDAASFYNKWIKDVHDSQNPNTGYVPNSAPWEPMAGGGPEWGAAICVMPWEFYLRYGDKDVLSDNLESMKGFLDYFKTWERPDGTVWMRKAKPDGEPFYWYNLGDWAPAFQTPEDALVHTFQYWQCALYTANAARCIGDNETAKEYSDLADRIKAAFNKTFYNAEEKSYGDFGSNVFALRMGVPEDRYEDVKATLRKEIGEKYDNHLNVGFIANRIFFETLSMNGLGDLAYAAMNQRTFPSYGWWIEQGATTTWEQWNGRDSRNHPMFGGGLSWFSRILAGVDTDPAEPGFKHIIVRPIPAKELHEVSYRTDTPYGEVVSKVTHDGTTVHMEVTVPAGAHATVYVPKSVDAAAQNPRSDLSYTRYEISSGTYRF